MGLATEGQYEELLARYATLANQVLKGEKVRNPHTSKLEDPDSRFLDEIETMLQIKRPPADFRREVISEIGAWSLDHRGQPVPYAKLFQNLLVTLRAAFFERHRATIARLGRQALERLSGEKPQGTTAEAARVDEVIKGLTARGYCDACGAEVLEFVLRERYA